MRCSALGSSPVLPANDDLRWLRPPFAQHFQQLAVHERFFLVRDLIDGDDRRDLASRRKGKNFANFRKILQDTLLVLGIPSRNTTVREKTQKKKMGVVSS